MKDFAPQRTNSPVTKNRFYSMIEPALMQKSELIVHLPDSHEKTGFAFLQNLRDDLLRGGSSVFLLSANYLVPGRPQLDVYCLGREKQTFFLPSLDFLLTMKFPNLGMIRVNHLLGFPFLFQQRTGQHLLLKKVMHCILSLQRKTQCRLICYFHDFFAVCPQMFLVRKDMTYCDPQNLTEPCRECLKEPVSWSLPTGSDVDLDVWRGEFRQFFRNCSKLLFFSKCTRNLLMRILPDGVPPEICEVHPPDFRTASMPSLSLPPQQNMVIGVIGRISGPDGLKQVVSLAEWIQKNDLPARIVVLGELLCSGIFEKIEQTGECSPAELPDLILATGINIIYYPSIWPETFSSSAKTVRALGLPVALHDLGEPAECFRNNPRAAFISDPESPENAWNTLCSLFEKTSRNGL